MNIFWLTIIYSITFFKWLYRNRLFYIKRW